MMVFAFLTRYSVSICPALGTCPKYRYDFFNLFSNAFKFTPSGGTVTVSLTATDHHAIVKATDTGCGMTAETGSRIFEKFYQGDTSHATHGNGLGLTLVKRIIDITNGEISVSSILNEGSTFTVKIPM